MLSGLEAETLSRPFTFFLVAAVASQLFSLASAGFHLRARRQMIGSEGGGRVRGVCEEERGLALPGSLLAVYWQCARKRRSRKNIQPVHLRTTVSTREHLRNWELRNDGSTSARNVRHSFSYTYNSCSEISVSHGLPHIMFVS